MIAKRNAAWLVAGAWLIAALGCSKSEPKDKQVASGQRVAQLSFSEGTEKAESAPISLTTSDGAGLLLVSLEARTVIEDPLAFTELHLRFRNPEPRRREGRFQIALPSAAAISRFAMRVGQEFQEGEVVERLKAQQVYEDFLHRKQDPALLEKSSGNEFSARVFPIEANADKEIIIAYSEELSQRDEPYRLLIAGLPELESLKVDVLLGSNTASGLESSAQKRGETARLTLEKQGFVPRADLLVHLPERTPFALRSGNLVVARVKPVPTSTPQGVAGLTILFDTSASRALGYAAQIERLGQLLLELARQNGKDFDVRVVAFDQDSEEVYRGAAGEFGLRDKGKLLAREALGATDLHQALSFVAEAPGEHTRLLLISDGMLTAGEEDATRLREAVARLSAHGVERLDVLAEGSVQDEGALQELTHAGLKTAGVVLSARAELTTVAKRLLLSARDKVEVHVAGASWVHPQVFEGVQAGDERLVFAELPPEMPVQIELSGAGHQALTTLVAPQPLLERAWARAKIEALTTELRGSGHLSQSAREQRKAAIVQLSTSQRVLSDYTALLVLETDADYRRFGLAQNALTSILRVGEEGIERFDRNASVVADVPAIARREGPEQQVAPQSASPEPFGEAEGAARAQPERSRRDADEADTAPAEREVALAPRAKQEAKVRERSGDDKGSIGAPRAESRPSPASAPARTSGGAPQAVARGASLDGLSAGLGSSGAPGRRPAPAAPVEVAAPPVLEPRAVVTLHSAQGLPQAAAATALRASLTTRARACYKAAATRREGTEKLSFELEVSDRGAVRDAYVSGGSLADARAQACVLAAVRNVQFPKPESGNASVRAGVELSLVAALAPRPTVAVAAPRPTRARVKIDEPSIEQAYDGDLAAVLTALKQGDTGSALSLARAARERDPADVLALVGLGEVLEAQRELTRAARVYGSIIDLFPSRADLRRMAGARLERVSGTALSLAVDSYQKAVEQRPDHPSGHRLLAYAHLKRGERAQAFSAIERALEQSYPSGRFAGVDRILREDLGLIAAAWLRAEPDARPRIEEALQRRNTKLDTQPSLRFVLNWDTDANDVDFHIYDGKGGHASYMKPQLGSGGALYADITTGYGPECFAITGAKRAYPYVMQAHYFSRGPMGYGMGKLAVLEHDGKGNLKFHDQPFVIMKDKAFVELLRIDAPLG